MTALRTDILYLGDNLEILREYVPDNSIDLIYLDPPFGSNRDYNLLYRENEDGRKNTRVKAFSDTWAWDGTVEDTLHDILCHDKELQLVYVLADDRDVALNHPNPRRVAGYE